MAKNNTQNNKLDGVIKELINGINKAYNSPVAMVADDIKLNKVRTGIFDIDFKLNGGIPRGRWIIAVGNESTFKSTFMYILSSRSQRVCGNCMTGNIIETDYKLANIVLNEKSNENVEFKNGIYYSKKYLADSKKRTLYIPEQQIFHNQSFKAYEYKIECSECNSPDYSVALIVDSEHNYTKEWAIKFNLVHGRVVLILPEYTEQAGEITREVLLTGRCSIIVVDSVPAIGSKKESDVSLEDSQMGLQARVWNKIVRVLTSLLNKPFHYTYDKKGTNEKVESIFRPEPILGIIQQWREKIGAYGNPNTMTAGRGLKFASSVTMEFDIDEYDYIDKKTKKLKGIWFSFILRKAKTATVLSNGRFYFNLLTHEIENEYSIIDNAISVDLIKQSGAWYIYKDIKYQGKEALIEKLKSMNEIEKIEKQLLDYYDKTTEK